MKKTEKTKKVSTDDLALMVAKGFAEAKIGLDKFKTETEENFHKVRHDVVSMSDSFVPRSEFETRLQKLQKAIGHQNERLSRVVDQR